MKLFRRGFCFVIYFNSLRRTKTDSLSEQLTINSEQFLHRLTPSVIASDHAVRGSAAICRFVSERLFRARHGGFLRPAKGWTRKDCVYLCWRSARQIASSSSRLQREVSSQQLCLFGFGNGVADCFVLADFVGASSQGQQNFKSVKIRSNQCYPCSI